MTEIATTAANATSTVVEHAAEAVGHAESGIHVAIAAEKLGTFMGFPITNTLVTSWGVMLILFVIAFMMRSRIKMIPSKLQIIVEALVGYVYDYVTETLGSRELARKYFPLIATLFIAIFASNILAFIPGIGSVGFYHGSEFVALFRSVNTDLNVTLALAFVSVLAIEFAGIAALGLVKYGGKFINFHSPMDFAVGLVELVGEVARLISLSFRLFGNILAGKILILVVIFFIPYLAPVPILMFELVIGFLQAAIFALLTLFFIKLAVTEAH